MTKGEEDKKENSRLLYLSPSFWVDSKHAAPCYKSNQKWVGMQVTVATKLLRLYQMTIVNTQQRNGFLVPPFKSISFFFLLPPSNFLNSIEISCFPQTFHSNPCLASSLNRKGDVVQIQSPNVTHQNHSIARASPRQFKSTPTKRVHTE